MDNINKNQNALLEKLEQLKEKNSALKDELNIFKQRQNLRNEEWENTFDSISDWICLIDLNAKILRSNIVGESYFNKPIREILGKTCCKTLHGTEEQLPSCPLFKMLKTKICETEEMKEANANRWFQITVDPFKNDDGEMIGAVHIVRDITEQKILEQEILIKNRALDSIINGVLITDSKQENNPVIYSNKASEILTGYSGEEILGKNCRFLQGNDRNQPELVEIREAIKEGRPCKTILKNYKKDGTLFWNELTISPVFDNNNNLVHFVGIQEDITGKLEALEKIRESDKRFKIISELTTDYAYSFKLLDKDHLELEWITEAYETITGYSTEEAKDQQSWVKALHPDDLQIVKERSEKLFSGHSDICEFRIVTKSGEIRWIRDHCRPVLNNKSKKVVGFVGAAKDITETKHAEMELKESEEKFRSLAENSPNMIFINKRGKNIYVNKLCEEITQYTKNELCSPDFDFFQLISPESKSLVEQNLNKHKLGNEVFPYELSICTKSGQKIDVLLNTRLINYQKDQAILGIFTDISEMKKSEKALRESEERFRGLSDAAFEAIFFSEKGICLDQNSTAEKMFGYTHSEAVGKKGTDWIIPADREMVMNNMLSGLEGPYETVALRKDGTTFPCEIQARMTFYKGQKVRITALQDITIRKEAEKALKESDAQFRLIAESVQDIFWISTPGLEEILYVSPAYKKIYGRSCESLIQSPKSFSKAIHPDDRERIHLEVENNKDGIWGPKEYRIIHQDGSVRWILDRGFPIYDEHGNLEKITGVVTDITLRKKAEEKILNQLNELQRWHDVTLDREDRVMQLKKEVNQLLEELKRPLRYESLQDS